MPGYWNGNGCILPGLSNVVVSSVGGGMGGIGMIGPQPLQQQAGGCVVQLGNGQQPLTLPSCYVQMMSTGGIGGVGGVGPGMGVYFILYYFYIGHILFYFILYYYLIYLFILFLNNIFKFFQNLI